jgi:uroporphyrinogen decarboxylase
MQTSRDAIDALLHGREADFVPLYDSPWGDTLKKWTTQGMPEGQDTTDHFGFDMVWCGAGFSWEAKPGKSETLEETDEWKIVRNGSGGVLKWWKERSGTPEHIDFAMNSRSVWEDEYKSHVLGDVRPRLPDMNWNREALRHRKEQGLWTYYGEQFIWENLRASLGDIGMFMALIEDPAWIHDFNRAYTDMYKRAYSIFFDEVGLPDGMWIYEDLGYRDRLFCSPEVLRDVIFPYYEEMVDFFHERNLPVVLHSCGYQAPMIPLAIEAGFDAINPMEVKAGNDILKYAELYGDRLCFVGGLDARVLESGDRDLIRNSVTGLVNGMRERGARFVYGSDHSLSTNIDYDDFMYSLEVYRDVRANVPQAAPTI